MKFIINTLLVLTTISTTYSREWTIELHPSQLKMVSDKYMQSSDWYMRKFPSVDGMTNLSYFTSTACIPPYKDKVVCNLSPTKNWPVLCIGHDFGIVLPAGSTIPVGVDYVASGYPILISYGDKSRIKKSFFTRQRCRRTAVGIHPNGSVIVYVSEAATIREVQETLWTLGCIHAINLDGGSSTFLVRISTYIVKPSKGRKYPNVLVWNSLSYNGNLVTPSVTH